MPRRYFHSTTAELETLYRENSDDRKVLCELADELTHRNRPRAKQLLRKVRNRLDLLAQPSLLPAATAGAETPAPLQHDSEATSAVGSSPTLPEEKPSTERKRSRKTPVVPDVDVSRVPLVEPSFPSSSSGDSAVARGTGVSNPEQVLKAWTAFEVLSPQSFTRPEELASGDRIAVALLTDRLPWERGERSKPNYRLYYQIVLGSIRMEPAIEALLEKYSDLRPERPSARGEAAMAVLVLDKAGRLVEPSGTAISSFGWAVKTALAGTLSELAGWSVVEPELLAKLQLRLLGPKPTDDDEIETWKAQPITHHAIAAAFDMLRSEFALPTEFTKPPNFAIRSYVYFRDSNLPEPLLLNSFFLKDLALASKLFAEGNAPENLRRYLGQCNPSRVVNLLDDRAAIESALTPRATPTARWPSRGSHALVHLQQAAVNLAVSQAEECRLVGINGPPGTGKTTLLRDVVADYVTRRADKMADLDDPQEAFQSSGERISAGQGWIHLYRLKPALRGYEMLVASSNNKAVENVSKALPELSAIAEDAEELRYLKTVSDHLHGTDTWGLIAAVLGRGKNRVEFKQKFWWDQDFGLSTYLAAACGAVRSVEERDPQSGNTIQRPPKIVAMERPPKSHAEAIQRWQRARETFLAAKERCLKWREYLTAIRSELARLDELASAAYAAEASLNGAVTRADAAEGASKKAHEEVVVADAAAAQAVQALKTHDRAKPGFFSWFFQTATFRKWDHTRAKLDDNSKRAGRVSAAAKATAQKHAELLSVAKNEAKGAAKASTAAWKSVADTRQRIAEAKDRFGVVLLDGQYFSQGHEELHLSTPWFPPAAQRCRDELLIAAMELHRAFVDAAAKPLRHNLGALMTVFTGGSFPTENKQSLLPDLWATLFLVVPVVSTTFASVDRMIGRLPPESLGLLLVDEAGQALPQAAVGALLRTKKAIFVGDPIQIEPVVTLPDTLTAAICRELCVDADRYSAPDASAQTLADSASAYVAEFLTDFGARGVGIPLLVHRRCEEPMFGISNSVAYCGQMVKSRPTRPSKIRDLLGPSRWFDVRGTAEDKWCDEEGRHLVEMLRQLARSGVEADFYVITPFVIVADRLRKLIVEEGVLDNWVNDEPWRWVRERVGTIHTVQGREAEAVFLVLGATAAQQGGARGWAGRRPNLLNVAVTRAKEVLYVIGNRELWKSAGVFQVLGNRLCDSSQHYRE